MTNNNISITVSTDNKSGLQAFADMLIALASKNDCVTTPAPVPTAPNPKANILDDDEPVTNIPASMNEQGVALDSEGLPWDARIHSGSKTLTVANGTWKLMRGVDKNLVAQVKEQYRIIREGQAAQAPAAPPVAAAVAAPPVAAAAAAAPPVAAAVVAPPVAAAVVAPPVAAAVVAPPVAAAAAAAVVETFPQLVGAITAKQNEGLLNTEQIVGVLNQFGHSSLAELAGMIDGKPHTNIPYVFASLEALWNSPTPA